MPNWQGWKKQSELECLAKSRYESIGVSLQIQLDKMIALVKEFPLTKAQQWQVDVAEIVREHADPFHPYGKPEHGAHKLV